MAHPLTLENIWFDRYRFEDAEKRFQESLVGVTSNGPKVQEVGGSSLVSEIARARNSIKSSLTAGAAVKSSGDGGELQSRLSAVEKENTELKKVTSDLQAQVAKLLERVNALEISSGKTPAPAATPAPAPQKKVEEDSDSDSDDDEDLFASDDEETKAQKAQVLQDRLKAYADKKSKKPATIAKSNVIWDVKPYDDTTDMKALESFVRGIEMDGLVWSQSSKLVEVAYGIKKLQIGCVIEDEKVSTEDMADLITENELIQSADIAAFNKV